TQKAGTFKYLKQHFNYICGRVERCVLFCRKPTDTSRQSADANCFNSFPFCANETPSHGLRQFPELQSLYVVEFALFSEPPKCGKDWHSPCMSSWWRKSETRNASGELDARRVDDMKAAVRHQLDPTIRSNDTCDFHSSLRAKIVGQEEGVQSLVDMFQVFCAGLNSPGRPVGNLLFLGPTGSGKTRIVEAAARSEEHTSELQSRENLVCRLLLEKK